MKKRWWLLSLAPIFVSLSTVSCFYLPWKDKTRRNYPRLVKDVQIKIDQWYGKVGENSYPLKQSDMTFDMIDINKTQFRWNSPYWMVVMEKLITKEEKKAENILTDELPRTSNSGEEVKMVSDNGEGYIRFRFENRETKNIEYKDVLYSGFRPNLIPVIEVKGAPERNYKEK